MKVPKIICLGGSTRFPWAFLKAANDETLKGSIVLSVHVFSSKALNEQERWDLNEHHLRQIDLADEFLFLNVGGYIGAGGRRELAYAEQTNTPICYLEVLPVEAT